jgi:formylglycine-generating enzyme required for sulfatase activity
MKYEVSQEQYVKFLNSLTFNQQTARTNISPASATGSWPIQTAAPNNARNGIRIMTPGTATTTPAIYGCDLNVNGTFNEAADGQNVACNWLSWPDLMTYLDWSGLRPMTEMEYEKACRGSGIPSVANEYAWGSTTILQATSGALTNGGQGAEVSTASGNGLCAYGSANATTFGPLRCGFAAGAATTRVQAGASYYGVMDMSGNVFEQCVGGRSFDYSSFNGLNGDGTITAAGLFNTANWPTAGGGNAGGITRGGSFNSGAPGELRLSDRSRMDNNTNQSKQAVVGGRGVRIP